MPVELRKRPPPKEPAAPPPAAKRGSGSTLKKLADKAKAAVGAGPGESGEPAAAATGPEQPMTTNTAAPVIPETVPAVPESATAESNGNAGDTGKLTVGQALNLDGFGGTVQTHDGTDVTVSQLLEKSGAGIVLFTYPKASTPGCKSMIIGIARPKTMRLIYSLLRQEPSVSLPRQLYTHIWRFVGRLRFEHG